jgi:hypothetical protein
VYFFVVSLTLASSIRKVFPELNWPEAAKGTDKDSPVQSVEDGSVLVVIVGTRTVIVTVAGLPGEPVPQPFRTPRIWYVVVARGSTEIVVSDVRETPE